MLAVVSEPTRLRNAKGREPSGDRLMCGFPSIPSLALHLHSTTSRNCMERIGIEPMTSWLQTRRSPS